jgi:hypothetical protein
MRNPLIIGITGRKGSGKDSAANVLIEKFGAHRQAFADPLRQIGTILFGITEEEMLDRALKETMRDQYPFESPRESLQKIGTECIRKVYPDAWLEAHRRLTTPHIKAGRDVVTPDVRFLNEAFSIRSRGGFLIRVDADERLGPQTDVHISETEMREIPVDVTLPNNDSPEKFAKLCTRIFSELLQKEPIE